jgi:hypothetical protein
MIDGGDRPTVLRRNVLAIPTLRYYYLLIELRINNSCIVTKMQNKFLRRARVKYGTRGAMLADS